MAGQRTAVDEPASSPWADAAEHAIISAMEELRNDQNATAMAAYMRDQFPFYGLKQPALMGAWRLIRRDVDGLHGAATADDLVAFAEAMWQLPEREHQYVGAKALDAASRRADLGGLGPQHLDSVRALIVARSWWDSVDILAPNVVGALARADPDEVVPVLDRWIVDQNMWLVRTAVIHQLKSKQQTDRDRLARYCAVAAPHPDFFVRKGIGWALRQYSYIDATWVESFVAEHADRLSRLSQREAMKAIERNRQGRA